jgi:hypothetical protein
VNKTVSPKQLELTAEKTRDELLIQALPPHINPDSPAFKADLEKIQAGEKVEAARAVLGINDDNEEFDWANDPSVILQEQRATAVYRNGYGGIVIRQEKYWNEETDPVVVITPENFVTFSEALAKRARE